MKLLVDEADLAPVIEKTVIETLRRVEAHRSRMDERLAFTEAEAAVLVGLPRHSLRDARLRGEVEATKVGRRILYRRDQLLKMLE